jgi:poly-gamma-glutamate synthesis protein (capsule biosynthesis protein)
MTATSTITVAGDFAPVGRLARIDFTRPEACAQVLGGARDVLRNSDLSIVHLEIPLTHIRDTACKSGPVLAGNPASLALLKAAGVHAVTLAGNHMLDKGPAGLCETITACEDNSMQYVGAGHDRAGAAAPLLHRLKDGTSVAILNYAEREFSIAGAGTPGANPWDVVNACRHVQQLKNEGHDIILVIIHGGVEYFPLPSPERVHQYRFLAEAGPTAILSHHTHCPSGYETHQGVPIFYGLGNFLFDRTGKRRPGWHEGYMVQLQTAGRKLDQWVIIPYRQCETACEIELLKGPQREQFTATLNKQSQTIVDDRKLQEAWHAFCEDHLTDYLLQFHQTPQPLAGLIRRCPLPARWFRKRAASDVMLNFLQCPSLREALTSMIRINRE